MYILGITGPLGHDAAACLMLNGEIIAAVEEERFTRIPHSKGGQMPYYAMEYCLSKAEITMDDVEYIVLSWDEKRIPKEKEHLLKQLSFLKDINKFIPSKFFNYTKMPKIEIVDHHLAHAASAYYFSSFDDASIVVIDGAGEDSSTSTYVGRDNKIEKIDSIHHNESLGEFYASATEFLGFDYTDPGKTMGLASFGEPTYHIPKISLDENKGYRMDLPHSIGMENVEHIWKMEFLRMGLKPNKLKRVYNPIMNKYYSELTFDQIHKNFASSVQKTLEDCYINVVKVLVEKTGIRNLCLAGGVALNCVANGKISQSGIVDDMFIQPAANDAGAAIGAAAEVSARLGYRIKPLVDVYSGPSFTNDQIEKTLVHFGINFMVSNDVAEKTSDFLASGRTIGWFQGAAEYGPRALGNRSILANPSIPNIQDTINNKVKFRESFRPFGPSVMGDKAEDWFEGKCSPFMLMSTKVKEGVKHLIEGVVHVDGTSRPQLVTKQTNSLYYSLIHNFNSKTSIPMVLNTSFNLRGEPMVATPSDALRTFFTSGLDVLVLNDYIIQKKF